MINMLRTPIGKANNVKNSNITKEMETLTKNKNKILSIKNQCNRNEKYLQWAYQWTPQDQGKNSSGLLRNHGS